MAEESLPQVEMTVEQILAAVLNKVGAVKMSQEDLFTDYSQFAVAVDPVGDGELQFALVEVGDLDAVSE
jgi:hypothetical protein